MKSLLILLVFSLPVLSYADPHDVEKFPEQLTVITGAFYLKDSSGEVLLVKSGDKPLSVIMSIHGPKGLRRVPRRDRDLHMGVATGNGKDLGGLPKVVRTVVFQIPIEFRNFYDGTFKVPPAATGQGSGIIFSFETKLLNSQNIEKETECKYTGVCVEGGAGGLETKGISCEGKKIVDMKVSTYQQNSFWLIADDKGNKAEIRGNPAVDEKNIPGDDLTKCIPRVDKFIGRNYLKKKSN